MWYCGFSQVEAQNVDIDLMNEFGYEMSQLMELAGLSCAVAVTQVCDDYCTLY